MGAASAADSSSFDELDNLNTIDGDAISPALLGSGANDNLGISEDDDILTASHTVTYTSLGDLGSYISGNGVSDGDIIYLNPNGNIVNYNNDPININKRVTIVGGTADNPRQVTIDGNNHGILNLAASGITLQNLNFINGNADNGGAININNGVTSTTIEDCTFTNNQARVAGGAIRNANEHGETLTITGCTFEGNKVTGDKYSDSTYGRDEIWGGGAIWSCRAITTVRDSTFIDNHANYGGALRGQFNIYDSQFERNVAENGNGGGIDVTCEYGYRMNLELNFVNCNFTNNTAKGQRSEDRAQGGGIHIYDIKSVDLTNCICSDNTADRGGGVDFYQMQHTHVENCTFDNNVVTSEGGGIAIFCNDSEFINIEVSNNKAGTDGGAIWVRGHDSVFDNVTSNNNTANRGGSTFVEGDNTVVKNSELDNNGAYLGGALYVEGQGGTFDNVDLSNNKAEGDDSYGGAVYVNGGNNVFNQVTSLNNSAESAAGSVYIEGDNNLFENSDFSNNSAPMGGAIAIVGSDSKFINNNITYNKANASRYQDSNLDGGAIYIVGDGSNFTNNYISHNRAKDTGGAIFVNGEDTYFENIVGDDNNAENGGFGALQGASGLIVKNSTFTNNHAIGNISVGMGRGEGGAFHIHNSDNVDIQGNFYNNTAINGSAIYVQESNIRIHDSRFFDNQALTHHLDIDPENETAFDKDKEIIVSISHIGGDNIANAIHDFDRTGVITVNNITYPFYHDGREYIMTTPNEDTTPVYGYQASENGTKIYEDEKENNQVIYYIIRNRLTNEIIENSSIRTDIDGTISINLTGKLPVGFYEVIGTYLETPYYTAAFNFTALFGVEGCNLTIEKTVNETPVYVNESVVFTINVTNKGPFNATHVNITDVVPPQFRVIGCNDTGYDNKTGMLVINLTVGQSYLFNITAVALVEGNWTNVANATCDQNDTVVEDNATVVVLPLGTINVTKVWNDAGNQDNLRPNNVTVILLADDEVYGRAVLNQSNGWKFTFTNLPVRKNGKNITYSIRELEVKNYTVNITRNNNDFIINNTHVPLLTNVSVEKIWTDNGNQDGVRPDYVTVVLLANGVVKDSVNLSDVNQWKHTFANLSLMENGKVIDYDIRELSVRNYTVNITRTADGNFVINNTHVPLLTEVNVTKIWTDDNNHDNLRPSSIRVRLFADGVNIRNATLNARNGWKFTFTELAAYNNGNPVNYTVDEVKVANYTANITGKNNDFVINNTHIPFVKLSIDKTADPGKVYVNETVVFTVNVTNVSPSPATDVKVTDVVPEQFRVTNCSDAAYNNETGVLTIDRLQPGESYSFTLTVIALVNGTWTNVASATCAENKTVVKDDATVIVDPLVNVTIIKNASTYNTVVNATVVFTITVTNEGPSNATNVTVTDVVPEGFRVTGFTNGYNNVTNQVVVPHMKANDTFTFTITAITLVVGDLNNTASVYCEENKTVKNDTVIVHVNPVILDIEKTVDNDTVYVNDTVVFTVKVTNNGSYNATGVVVRDVLPEQFTFVETNDTNFSNNVLNIERLDIGQSYAFTITAIANVNGTYTNIANATCNENKTVVEDNATVEVKPLVNVTIIKNASTYNTYVNATVVFTITVTNEGPSNATNVTITDVVPEGFRVTGFTNGYNNVTNQVIVPHMKANETYSFTITAITLVAGDLNNTASVYCEENKTVKNDTVIVHVKPVMLSIEKTVDNDTVYVNDTVVFTVKVTNNGSYTATSVVVRDVLPEQFTFVETNDTNYRNNVLKISRLGAGKSYAFTITAIANVNGTYTNVANATCKQNKTVVEDNATVKVKPVVNVTINKTVDLDRVYINETVVFTITVTNEGPSNATNVVITDVVPEQFTVTAYDEGYDNTTNTVTIKKMEVGDSYTFTITAIALVNGTLNNTANVTCDENRTVKNSTVNVTVDPLCDLEVRKEVSDLEVFIGDELTWTIIVINHGPSAAENVVVNDTLPDGLRLISSDGGRVVGNDIIWNIQKLAANGTVSFEIVTVVEKLGNITNPVEVDTTTNETNKTNNKANNTTYVKPLCDLEITKLVNATEIFVGENVKWTISVINKGPCVARDVIVYDTLPNSLHLESVPENCRLEGNVLIWTIGDMDLNASISLDLVTTAMVNGSVLNVVVVNTTTNDTNESNNKANNTTYVNPICDLEISKSVNASRVYVNDVVEWTIVVTNKGPSTALDVVVKDTLPEGVLLLKATPSVGSFDNESGIWKIGSVEKDKSVSLILETQLMANGTFVNVATVNTTINETDKTNNEANNTTVADPICDLIIFKAVNVTRCYVDEYVSWNITVVNKGPCLALEVEVKDLLPDSLEYISSASNAGSFDKNSGIWKIGDLDVDTPVSLNLITKVLTNGTITNIARVNTTIHETNESNNEANNTTVADPICDLDIAKYVSDDVVNVSDDVTWMIVVRNSGPCDALDVKVTDILPASLKLVDVKASKGTFNKNSGVWNIGKLANGASAILTLKTKVLAEGNIVNNVSVTTTVREYDYTNNNATNSTYAKPICDLVLKKSSDKQVYALNETVHWIINVVNKGPCDTTDVVVSDALPSACKFISYTATKGTYDENTGKWIVGDLANGESVTLDIVCKAISTGVITNNASVTSSVPDIDESNNFDNATITVLNDTPVKHDVPTLHETGNPIAYLVIAIVAIFGSFWSRNRRE